MLRQHILGSTNFLPLLGELVIRGDEELKIVTATLIRTLGGGDSQTSSLFWTANELGDSQIRSFPLTDTSSGKEWMEELTTFIDDAVSQNKAIDR